MTVETEAVIVVSTILVMALLSAAGIALLNRYATQAASPRNCTAHGHRFEPRYDRDPTKTAKIEGLSSAERIKLVESMTRTTYVCDVCVFCGEQKGRAAK